MLSNSEIIYSKICYAADDFVKKDERRYFLKRGLVDPELIQNWSRIDPDACMWDSKGRRWECYERKWNVSDIVRFRFATRRFRTRVDPRTYTCRNRLHAVDFLSTFSNVCWCESSNPITDGLTPFIPFTPHLRVRSMVRNYQFARVAYQLSGNRDNAKNPHDKRMMSMINREKSVSHNNSTWNPCYSHVFDWTIR